MGKVFFLFFDAAPVPLSQFEAFYWQIFIIFALVFPDFPGFQSVVRLYCEVETLKFIIQHQFELKLMVQLLKGGKVGINNKV